jgi:fibronectin type 3 domain-containing protein
LTWNPVGGASGYKVKWSATDGGPYVTHATVTATSALVPGLTNGVLYYFVVTAINGGVESATSAQVQMRPFNPAVNVHAAGQLKDWRQGVTFKVDPLGPPANRPALYLNYYREDLTQTGIGSRGYKIFNFGGLGSENGNVASGFSITKGTTWAAEHKWTQQTFEIGTQNSDGGALYADGTSGTISVLVSDTNWHYMTVFSPSRFNSPRTYTVKLASQEHSSQVVTHTVDTGIRAGYSQVFQFLFRGNVTLTVEGPALRWATVAAVFLDDAAVSLTPPPPPPPAPTGLSATGGTGQISLAWNASAGATSYTVKRSTTSGSGYQTIGTTAGTTYVDTSVTPNITYYYVVAAVNSGGSSANSGQAFAMANPGVPAAPTGLSATPGNAQVALTWNSSSGATSYKVKRSTMPGSGYSVIAPSVGTTSYTDTTAANGTTYYYVVSAVNGSGESPNSNEANATPSPGSPPAAPTGLVAGYGNASVSLSWNTSSGATSYKAKRSTTSGGPYSVIAPSLTFPWHTDNSVVNDTTYFYVVSAVNGFGESTNSSEANATPVAADPLLSLGRPVVVSSADPCCVGPGAVDGNANTRWSSLVGIDPGWIYVDLGAVYTIHRVKLNWEWSYAVSYKIQVSMDAVNWYDAYSTTTSSGGLQTINVVAAGRYVRMYGTQRSGPGGYSLWEFQVFGRNPVSLSQGQAATASSYDTTYLPAKAVDGDFATRWSSAMGSDPQWIYVDTGAIQSINRVRAVWEAAYATQYKIQFSSDLVNWQDMYVTTSGTGGTNDIPVFGSGRYVRMYGTQRGTPYGYSLWEFQVFR